ncbi:phage tail protein [Yersinia ruckeri]|uniref:phage tail protein n=1 Tax=Yersinia ruckeri TaxID=29486 RepID=UPI002238DD7A|nr:phage tail protein [Yersinia ruckeri]MCW6591778.1 phage tail protein [Yersinia ruckeri]UZX91470.1 phage tail protein [Yersinia ruckeri]
MKETHRLIIGNEKQMLTGLAVVGPETNSLKERFKEGSIPLQTDFEKLIDIAAVGRKAAGLAPGQTGPGNGFQLDSVERLSVKVDSNSGLSVTSSGVKVIPKNSGGVVVDSTGISVKPGRGMEVTSDGVRITNEFAFQKGMILMFAGTAAEMPPGWALCDGSNGRPNLIDRFILGSAFTHSKYSNTAQLAGSGNTKTYNKQSTPFTVTGTVNIAETILTLGQIPRHNHNDGVRYTYKSGNYDIMNINQYGSVSVGTGSSSNKFARLENFSDSESVHLTQSSTVGDGGGHKHTATMSTNGHQHSTDVIPPYYTLAFIIKL